MVFRNLDWHHLSAVTCSVARDRRAPTFRDLRNNRFVVATASYRGLASGANPTPQLPIRAVVTPCADDGIMRSLQDACPS
jgi:hypothetical protein